MRNLLVMTALFAAFSLNCFADNETTSSTPPTMSASQTQFEVQQYSQQAVSTAIYVLGSGAAAALIQMHNIPEWKSAWIALGAGTFFGTVASLVLAHERWNPLSSSSYLRRLQISPSRPRFLTRNRTATLNVLTGATVGIGCAALLRALLQ